MVASPFIRLAKRPTRKLGIPRVVAMFIEVKPSIEPEQGHFEEDYSTGNNI